MVRVICIRAKEQKSKSGYRRNQNKNLYVARHLTALTQASITTQRMRIHLHLHSKYHGDKNAADWDFEANTEMNQRCSPRVRPS